MAKSKYIAPATNKNSRVNTRIDRTGKLRTETVRRDDGELDVSISTDERTNSTRVFIDARGREGNFTYPDLELNGRQARTLLIALQRHFSAQGKSIFF